MQEQPYSVPNLPSQPDLPNRQVPRDHSDQLTINTILFSVICVRVCVVVVVGVPAHRPWGMGHMAS